MRSAHSAARRLCKHGSFGTPLASRGLPSHASCEYGECRCTIPRAVVQPRALPVLITVAAGSVFCHAGSVDDEPSPQAATTTQRYQALIGRESIPSART